MYGLSYENLDYKLQGEYLITPAINLGANILRFDEDDLGIILCASFISVVFLEFHLILLQILASVLLISH